MTRRLRFELLAMALIVTLAGLSVLATFGSARSTDLVFCRMVDGGVVVGVTTDCSATPGPVSVGDPSASLSGWPLDAAFRQSVTVQTGVSG